MSVLNITQDLSHDDDIVVLKVVDPKVVTPNKPIHNKISNLTNVSRKYDKSLSGFKRIYNTAFPYHGDNSFAAVAYGNDPDIELLHNLTSTSISGKQAKDQETVSVSSLRLDRTKQCVSVMTIFQSIVRLIFKMTFKSFYDFDMRANRISPELIEITDTE